MNILNPETAPGQKLVKRGLTNKDKSDEKLE